MQQPAVRVVVGPTASGKTRAAVAVARALDGVVLSADARQAYVGLDAATGKEGAPSSVDLPGVGRVPSRVVEGVHQVGLDLASPSERLTAARWHAWAARAVDALLAEGRAVVVAGGTGLYVEALLRGFRWPDADEAVRARFAHLPRREARRAEMDALGARPDAVAPPWSARVVGIDPPRAAHRAAIEARVRAWFADDALLREAAALDPAWEAATAIGYAEAHAVAEARLDRDEAARRAVSRTWAYARRQRAYFRRRLPEAAWVATPEEAVARLVDAQLHPRSRAWNDA